MRLAGSITTRSGLVRVLTVKSAVVPTMSTRWLIGLDPFAVDADFHRHAEDVQILLRLAYYLVPLRRR